MAKDKKDKELPTEVTPRIVAAVMVSANTGQLGGELKSKKALYIEGAMSDAVQGCYDAGKIDPDYVRKQIMLARDQAEERWNAAETANGLL